MLVATACTGGGDDGEERPDGGEGAPRLQVEVTGLVAEPADSGDVRLAWDRIDDIPAYRVGYGDVTVDVPAAICAATCAVHVRPEPVGEAYELAVRAVRGGSVSAPAPRDLVDG